MILNTDNIELENYFLKFVNADVFEGGDPSIILGFDNRVQKFTKIAEVICVLSELTEHLARELVVPIPKVTPPHYPFYYGGDTMKATPDAHLSIWSAAMEFGIPVEAFPEFFLVKIEKI
jgi:hypothetical protein